ncbi:uncharacterized protein LOC133317538 [Gastrolobium bilobum]|uniref:uncharacterized protein LOC133317538 n=1 Tax=Gastrolobium bilobum TaxID=150636 RepID=UPI002AB1E9AD|nr:uncharacterized protein LOC133317538 [Gastrolobium bilobum]
MEGGSSGFSAIAPPIFDRENYQAWAMRMQAYLEGCDFWESVEQDYEVAPLPKNPTINQIKFHKERITRKAKAKSCLYAVVSPAIFSRIMACESAQAIWDFLKDEYKGDERIRSMKGLNLVTQFERLQMKESETIKEYSDKLVNIANQARALGTNLSDNRLVQKVLVSLPERFEATIASLENTKDLSQIKLAELLSALQVQEQRRLMRLEGSTEGALQAKEQHNNHPHFRRWKRPDVKCRKCHRLGHIERFCKEKGDQQQGEAHVADQHEADHLFAASCFSSSAPCDSWLVDSGCTNHMAIDEKLFRDLDKSLQSRVRIGNGEYLEVKGKGTVAIESYLELSWFLV